MMGSILRDVRFGARSLLRAPVFAGVSVLTLAIGVGATTAIFSVVHGVLLAPLSFEDPDALVDISVNTGGASWYGSSVPEYLDYEEQMTTLQNVGGYATGVRTVGDSLQPRRVPVAFFTQGVFPTLGVNETVIIGPLSALLG